MIESAVTPQTSTKERILDAAEQLFAKSGIEATSLRAITAEAGVNLAAVNYHFQSKEVLVRAVFARRIEPMNQRRLKMLDALEAEAGDQPVVLEKLLEALLAPVFDMAQTNACHFVPLMGRMYSQPAEFVQLVYREQIEPVANRFWAALERALPALPREEVAWRLQFMIGAMAHSLAAGPLIRVASQGLCDPSDTSGIVRRLITCFSAALRAPVMESSHAS